MKRRKEMKGLKKRAKSGRYKKRRQGKGKDKDKDGKGEGEREGKGREGVECRREKR